MSPLDKIWFWSRNQRVISTWISLKRLGTGAGSKAEGGLRFHPWSWAFGAHRPGRMTKLDGLKPLDVAAFNPDLNPFVLRWTCIIHITGQGGQSGPQIDKASQQCSGPRQEAPICSSTKHCGFCPRWPRLWLIGDMKRTLWPWQLGWCRTWRPRCWGEMGPPFHR